MWPLKGPARSLALLSVPLRSRQRWGFKSLSTLRHQPWHLEPPSSHCCCLCSSPLTVPCVTSTTGYCTAPSSQTPSALLSLGSVWEDLDQSECVGILIPCQNFTAGRLCALGWETVQSWWGTGMDGKGLRKMVGDKSWRTVGWTAGSVAEEDLGMSTHPPLCL